MLIKLAETLALCLPCDKSTNLKNPELLCSLLSISSHTATTSSVDYETTRFLSIVNIERIFCYHQLRCIIDKEMSILLFCKKGRFQSMVTGKINAFSRIKYTVLSLVPFDKCIMFMLFVNAPR